MLGEWRRRRAARRRAKTVKALLRAAPGPSPWCLLGPDAGLPSRLGTLRWREISGHPHLAGLVALRAPDGATLALLDSRCYVRPMAPHRVMVWHGLPDGAALRFRVLDVDRLAPIAGPETAAARLRAERAQILTVGGDVTDLSVPADLPPGRHEVRFPHEMYEVEEVLALATARAGGLRLLLLRPREGAVEVVPQDWYNEGGYEAGQQWVTRVAREPDTGRLVGEGMQMPLFVLDPSMRRVAEWIR